MDVGNGSTSGRGAHEVDRTSSHGSNDSLEELTLANHGAASRLLARARQLAELPDDLVPLLVEEEIETSGLCMVGNCPSKIENPLSAIMRPADGEQRTSKGSRRWDREDMDTGGDEDEEQSNGREGERGGGGGDGAAAPADQDEPIAGVRRNARGKIWADNARRYGNQAKYAPGSVQPEDVHGGHAALTSTQAMMLPSDVQLYTFGSPRVGNHAMALRLDALVPLHFRVVLDGDVIASVPKLCWMYKHAGTKVDLDRQGNCVVDPSFLEWQLRASAASSISSHMMSSYRRSILRARAMEGLKPSPGLLATRAAVRRWIQMHRDLPAPASVGVAIEDTGDDSISRSFMALLPTSLVRPSVTDEKDAVRETSSPRQERPTISSKSSATTSGGGSGSGSDD